MQSSLNYMLKQRNVPWTASVLTAVSLIYGSDVPAEHKSDALVWHCLTPQCVQEVSNKGHFNLLLKSDIFYCGFICSILKWTFVSSLHLCFLSVGMLGHVWDCKVNSQLSPAFVETCFWHRSLPCFFVPPQSFKMILFLLSSPDDVWIFRSIFLLSSFQQTVVFNSVLDGKNVEGTTTPMFITIIIRTSYVCGDLRLCRTR